MNNFLLFYYFICFQVFPFLILVEYNLKFHYVISFIFLFLFPLVDYFLLSKIIKFLRIGENVEKEIKITKWKKYILKLFLIFNEIECFLFILYSFYDFYFENNVFNLFGKILSLSMYISTSITSIHELIHEKKWKSKVLKNIHEFFSFSILTFIYYNHFPSYHKNIHHHYVGTPKDLSTARKGDSYYKFIFNSYFRGRITMIKREFENKENKLLIFYQCFFSEEIFNLTVSLILSFYVLVLGVKLLFIQFLVTLFSIMITESVNYFEHYGLKRNKNNKITKDLSWDGDSYYNTSTFCNINYHSKHHMNPNIKFYELTIESMDKAPRLPYSYPTMIVLSLYPSLFFKKMDKILEEFEMRCEEIDKNEKEYIVIKGPS